ncbi:hypothetical protein L6452_25560 [Arctium lappa]|uniref:Uncharacterized protein n=1 Tax=Arctium lappa TaxID=4217 RepID=A0ACB9AC73_ARCLA|nr:hypothetical protein L6452_25560 [Arctium lappa]
MYYNRVYHLFYQYNPYGSIFNKTIIWGHSVSRDLVNWIHLKNAIIPTNPFDINSCWSGSTTILPENKPVILYTGIDANNQQVQNLAMPKNLSDPFLQEWVKYSGNPIMTPPHGVKPDNFRDPTTAWKGKDGIWRVAIGGLWNDLGVAILYRSKDFVRWSLQRDPLYFGENTGVWECPDFYPVFVNDRNGVQNSANGMNLKYVMKASFKGNDYYTIGRYDADKEKFTPDDKEGLTGSSSDLRYDYGKFYASKTFFDSEKKRRILWGWINEGDRSTDDIEKGWAGIQSIPRQVYLSITRKQLIQWPVKETEQLRDKKHHVTYSSKKLKGESLFEVSGITASQVDIEVSFMLPKLEEVEVLNPNWNDPQLVCSGKTATVSGRVGPFGLLLMIDHSVIESFGAKGRACITARVYPQFLVHKEAHIYVFNNGSLDVVIPRLNAWSMKKAKGN